MDSVPTFLRPCYKSDAILPIHNKVLKTYFITAHYDTEALILLMNTMLYSVNCVNCAIKSQLGHIYTFVLNCDLNDKVLFNEVNTGLTLLNNRYSFHNGNRIC